MTENNHPRTWGYAGVHPGDFVLVPGDKAINRLVFAATHGFDSTGLDLREVESPARRDFVKRFVEEHGLRLSAHMGVDYFANSDAQTRADVEAVARTLEARAADLPIELMVVVVGPYHRYMDEPGLSFQLERLRAHLPRLADACGRLGIPLGIENHADYWMSDLVELCERVQGLGIFMDTGNCCVVGERPVEACRLAAPHTVGTHFKDHKVWPKLKDGLAFMVSGAALGEGHVGLEEIYADLIRLHPDPASIRMEVELIPDREIDAAASLERTKAFITRVCGRRFEAPRTITVGEVPS